MGAEEWPRVEGGDPAVNGSFLHPYTNRWSFSIERPGSAPVEAGVWTDVMEPVSFEGRPALKRTQVAEYKKGIRLTFVDVFDPKSMAIHVFDYTRSDNGESRHLESDGQSIRFLRRPGSDDDFAQDYVAKLDHRVLDFYDGMYGILLDAFPLREGYEVSFSGFDTDRAAVDWIHLRVSGRETVPAGKGKTAETWVVQIETKLYGTEHVVGHPRGALRHPGNTRPCREGRRSQDSLHDDLDRRRQGSALISDQPGNSARTSALNSSIAPKYDSGDSSSASRVNCQ